MHAETMRFLACCPGDVERHSHDARLAFYFGIEHSACDEKLDKVAATVVAGLDDLAGVGGGFGDAGEQARPMAAGNRDSRA